MTLIAAWLWTAAASAGVTLDYEAPASCPDADRFSDEVAARLGRVAFSEDGGDPVVVRIVAGTLVRGTLAVPGGGKVVDGEVCESVFDALVTSAAVLLDPASAAPAVAVVRATAVEPLDLLIRAEPPYGTERAPDWVVRFESGSPMETEPFLRVTEAPELPDFRRAIQGRNTRAAVVAGVGIPVALVSAYALPYTVIFHVLEPESVPLGWTALAGGGLVVGTSLVVAAIAPLMRSSRDRKDPSRVIEPARADALIEAHNTQQQAPP